MSEEITELEKEETEAIEEAANTGSGRVIDIETDVKSDRRRLIVSLTWPALMEGLLTSLVSMVDMMMVAEIGKEAINAVGLVTQPRFIMLAAFMALGVGVTAMTARFKGARDRDGARLVFNQSIIMSLSIAVLLCVVMYATKEPLLNLIAGGSLSETSVQGALTYFRIQIIGFPTVAISFIITAALRGVGNTRASFYSNTLSNLVNVFFNYCLISGRLGFPKLGVAGASIATVIGQSAGLVMLIFIVVRGQKYLRLEPRNMIRLNFDIIRRITKIGLPALFEQVTMRAGMLLFTMIVVNLGDDDYAAHLIAMSIQTLSFAPGMAFGTASTTLTGQSLGRVREDLARIYISTTQKIALVVSVCVSAGLFFGGSLIAGLYSDEVLIIAKSALMLKIIAVTNPVSNARFIMLASLRGAGDSKFAAAVTFVSVIFLRTILSFILTSSALPIQLGLTGVWIALASDGVAAFFAAFWRYRQGKWASIKV